MPSDIRSFFGGKPPASSTPAPAPKEPSKKRGRSKKIVSDDEDEEGPVTKRTFTPTKKSAAKKEPSPPLEETTADNYFGKGAKPKRSEGVSRQKRAAAAETNGSAKTTPKKRGAAANGVSSTRSSARKTKGTSYVELDENDFPDDDLEDEAEDNFKAEVKVGRRAGDGYKEESEDEDDKPLVPKKKGQMKIKDEEDFEPEEDVDMKDVNADDDFVVPDDDEEIVEDKPAKKNTKTPAKGSKKRKSTHLEDDEDDGLEIEEVKPAAKKRDSPAQKSTPAKKKQKKEDVQDSAEMKAIFDSIPTIRAPSPPKKDGDEEKPKFQYGGQHANSAAPAGAIDVSEMPSGEENCLAGLTFVFTGQLQRLGREQGQSLVKQWGGKVTGAPSKKTSYVVLGDDAGPKKLETIKQHGLKVINEDGLFELIRRLPANGGDSAAAEENRKKKAKDEENIRKAAEEMEKQERATLAASKPKPRPQGSSDASSKGKAPAQGPDTRLWTVRYAPQELKQICGNKTAVEKLQRWLRAFPKSQRTKFKMPGPDGSGIFRAVMIHGPPGIGKTTAAHLVAKLEGYDIVESNASDTRSKKLVETGLKGVLSTTSLMGYFGTSGSSEAEEGKKNLVLIMDEVDGMSAGDRGGVGALAAVCKKSQIPMILICNDRKLPKMKPFDFVTYDLPFRRPTTDQIRSRISTIAFREGLKMPANVINALIEGSGADIRQVVNMISTAKLDASTSMSFDEGKDMSKAWEKHIVLKPWDMVSKILGGGMFNPASKATLNEKQELYFNDHEFAPLMMQENYLGTNPARTNQWNDKPKMKKLASLDLASKAAEAISDGDLVDRMIHGSQQQWGLMPTHAMLSFVRPASFIYGSMAGHHTRFTAWLGKNSSQSKFMRQLKEIQGHMRLRVSADRFEIRQSYQPVLFERLVRRLQREGKEAVPEIIELMDGYFLTKEDWDAVLELGVGGDEMEGVKIDSTAKAAFTRMYNQQSHPLPFMKASSIVAPKRAPAKEKPDLEEALEESEEEAIEAAEAKEDDEEVDLSKDKYVKVPKKKKAAAAGKKGAGGAGKKKGKVAADDEEDDEEDEDEKPTKGKAKTGAKGKGRAKK
ncbi:DNA replication factor C complex subunit Rfc1 [Vermiconidia calcicola]|uniref:DNA replication factor C complex subunit Rfc1 n=1 Tax=Vermiconidia calcicola TaxID=1690605 RepID=A0ACC3MMK5_9PEZI|nr:DNA replication factor C complex subunit Rfc1 [Vermiconidia calcicola]